MTLPTLADADRELVRRHGLAEFVRLAWPVLEPTEPLRWGWALDAMCAHLEAVTDGRLTRLLMTVPPGMMKSLLTTVFWPAWEWGPGGYPEHRVLGSSYSESYALRDSRKMRDLVASDWYQSRWPVRLVQDGERLFANDRTGFRQAVPFSRLTGGRGHRVIVDDPHSTEKAESDADRERAVRIMRESVPSRVVDPVRSAIVVIMQRLHTADVAAEALTGDRGYEHLMLPMRFEPERRCHTSIGFVDPRVEPDELLFPERFPLAVVERDEATMGSYATAAQYQQRPAPRGGGVVKEAWLVDRYARRGERPLRVLQSWDTASKAKEANDPSCCTTLAEFDDRLEVWYVDVKRREFPALVQAARDLYASPEVRGPTAPNAVLVEDKDSGQQLIQWLRKTTKLPVVPIDPRGLDKETRLRTETPIIEAGQLRLPADAPWVAAWLAELTTFPNSPHKDQADSLSQALKYVREHPARVNIPGPGGATGAGKFNE